MSHRLSALICALACSVATPVQATVTLPVDLNTLVAEAWAIAQGRIVDLRSRPSGDGARVETLVTMQVRSYLKGDLGDEVTFVVAGGTVGRYKSVLVGAPQFTRGEEVVLFLGARPPSFPYVLRLGQGVFPVKVDERTGERTIARRIPLGPGSPPVVRGAASNRPMSLASFTALVHAALEKSR